MQSFFLLTANSKSPRPKARPALARNSRVTSPGVIPRSIWKKISATSRLKWWSSNSRNRKRFGLFYETGLKKFRIDGTLFALKEKSAGAVQQFQNGKDFPGILDVRFLFEGESLIRNTFEEKRAEREIFRIGAEADGGCCDRKIASQNHSVRARNNQLIAISGNAVQGP